MHNKGDELLQKIGKDFCTFKEGDAARRGCHKMAISIMDQIKTKTIGTNPWAIEPSHISKEVHWAQPVERITIGFFPTFLLLEL